MPGLDGRPDAGPAGGLSRDERARDVLPEFPAPDRRLYRRHVEYGDVRGDPEGAQQHDVVPDRLGGDQRDFSLATNYASAFTTAEYLVPPSGCENRTINAWAYRGLQYYRG